jgi:membrane protein implicated in regulation of membrane protease activity
LSYKELFSWCIVGALVFGMLMLYSIMLINWLRVGIPATLVYERRVYIFLFEFIMSLYAVIFLIYKAVKGLREWEKNLQEN